MTIYLLHFSKPYKHARHYLGITNNLSKKLEDHRKGKGARLLEVVVEAGIGFECVRIWEDSDRTLERKLKNRKNTPYLCPICNPKPEIQRGPMA